MEKIKIGVIGCGSIAQIMHIPHLKEIKEYELKSVCDISPKLVQKIGDYYNVKGRYIDFRELLHSDIDAVLVSTLFSHANISTEAAKAGKHVLVEKPMCTNLKEADEMIEAAKENNVKLMVAYMKRYDPGYIYAQKLIAQMEGIKLIRLHNAFGPNRFFMDDVYNTIKYDDVTQGTKDEARRKYLSSVEEAVGDVPDHVRRTYSLMLGVSTHDVNILRGILNSPINVLSTEIWDSGSLYTSTMNCGNEIRCVFDTGIIGIKKFDEEIAVFGNNEVVKANFPSPYLRNTPTSVTIWKMEGDSYVESQVFASYKESFKQELMHFHHCIVNDKKPLTDGEDGRKDLELLLDMLRAYSH